MDTKHDNIIKVEIEDSVWVKFALNFIGLWVHDIRNNNDNASFNGNKNRLN